MKMTIPTIFLKDCNNIGSSIVNRRRYELRIEGEE